jgi:flagellar assembly factor FliW
MRNSNLQTAKTRKDDEFYTGYNDIKKELINYAKYFKGKVIYCNCDDHAGIGLGSPKSNFLKYLADNFEAFQIKKVIATHYEKDKATSTMYILDKDNTGDGITCFEDITEIPMKGNGDFRSPECVELLKQADIVITNPPFSLFREYVAQLMEYKKKFLIIGNKTSLSCKEIFAFAKENKIWLGYNSPSDFTYQGKPTKKVTGLTRWYTNLENSKRNEILNTGKKYYGFEDMYPQYDNYDAINVDKVSDIPMDYEGVMGVPITFLDKYNPDQFLILGNEYDLNISKGRGYVAGKRKFGRIFISRKKKDY